MQLSRPTVLILGIAFAFLLWWAGSEQGRQGVESHTLDSLFALRLTETRDWRTRLAEERQKARIASQRLAGLQNRVSVEKGRADSLGRVTGIQRDSLGMAETTIDSLAVFQRLTDTQAQQIQALTAGRDSAVVLAGVWQVEAGRWQALSLAADSTIQRLTSTLEAVNRKRVCRIAGMIPCPSRGTTFLVGLGLGLVGGVIVSH